MSSNTFISVWVRQAIGSMMERAAQREKPLVMREALVAIRRRFPDLVVSDKDLTAGVMGEAVAAGAKVVFDSGSAERTRPISPTLLPPNRESEVLPPTVIAALQAFFESYGVGERAFAVSDAIRAVRQVVPESELSNNDLLAAIAAAGSPHGGSARPTAIRD